MQGKKIHEKNYNFTIRLNVVSWKVVRVSLLFLTTLFYLEYKWVRKRVVSASGSALLLLFVIVMHTRKRSQAERMLVYLFSTKIELFKTKS